MAKAFEFLPPPLPSIIPSAPIPVPPTIRIPAQPGLPPGAQPAITLPLSPTGYQLLAPPGLGPGVYIPPQVPVIATPTEVFSFDPTGAVITGATPSDFPYYQPPAGISPLTGMSIAPPPVLVQTIGGTLTFDPITGGAVYV